MNELTLLPITITQEPAVQYTLFEKESPPNSLGPTFFCREKKLKTTVAFDSYWRLAHERQEILFKRFENAPSPWTQDPIIARFKFTNAYRAADRTSQFLIRDVIYREDLPSSPQEVVFRILLFKLFNKIETWDYLEREFGSVTWEEYRFEKYDRVLSSALAAKCQIYSAAYMMPPGGIAFGHVRKHQNHLRLLELMMRERLPDRLAASPSMGKAFQILRSYPTIGDFLAYQYATDINYSEVTDFSEQEFVVPGPGARDGIQKCFRDMGGMSESEVIRLMMERQGEEFARLGLPFRSLWGRSLQLIDCQNLFCEVSKYARVRHPEIKGCSNRMRIKQLYKPSWGQPIHFFFPPKWRINHLLNKPVNQ